LLYLNFINKHFVFNRCDIAQLPDIRLRIENKENSIGKKYIFQHLFCKVYFWGVGVVGRGWLDVLELQKNITF
jgi:hypothetical protein